MAPRRAELPVPRPSDYDRFMAKIEHVQHPNIDGPCWEWQAYVDPNGYSRFSFGSKANYGHVFSYLYHYDEIPEGMEVDHLCRNRRCVNPEHLEAVTHRVNCERSPIHVWYHPHLRSRVGGGPRTHCPRGHELTDENTYAWKDKRRWCRECMRVRRREYKRAVRQRNREEKARKSEAA